MTQSGSAGVFTQEQEELRESARRLLAEKSGSADIRRLAEGGESFDPDTWKQIAELGWLGIAIPEEYGGLGYSFVELFVILEEMGRRLLVAPFFSSIVLAAPAIELAGNDQQKKNLLAPIADGSLRATLAATSGTDARATQANEGYALDGNVSFVLDGADADTIIVAAASDGGTSLFVVESNASGLERVPLTTLDETRRFAELRFSSTPAELLGEAGNGDSVLTQVLDRAAIALAGEAIGGAQECLEQTVQYAKDRTQFDRPVGSFQAIQHRLADLYMEVEMARSAAYYAAWAAAENSDEVPRVAPLAKAYCTETFFHAASESIQVHAGIGFTWEHDAHLYFKRAQSSALFLGTAAENRERLAQRLEI
ncbi:MAG TPA: acyl-CoA dehydrogenase family protein [Actinomycetota bacterium]|nr:acyl-CoA dehydrogenase family protein [Actinomycetota bacterium]